MPDKYTVTLDQLVVHTNFPLPSKHRLLQEINAERLDVSNKLALPVSDETINVYLFHDAEQFTEFIRLKYPNFPDRRAFFVETDTRLEVYAQWGDRTAEDLRHEVCHGYLHSVLENLPLWLDEGIAEYFEPPRGTHGLNSPHVKQLNELIKAGKWHPNLQRLEAMRSPAEMTETDYAESWAWVHWMLETEPIRRTLLQEYLAEVRTQRRGAPAIPAIAANGRGFRARIVRLRAVVGREEVMRGAVTVRYVSFRNTTPESTCWKPSLLNMACDEVLCCIVWASTRPTPCSAALRKISPNSNTAIPWRRSGSETHTS